MELDWGQRGAPLRLQSPARTPSARPKTLYLALDLTTIGRSVMDARQGEALPSRPRPRSELTNPARVGPSSHQVWPRRGARQALLGGAEARASPPRREALVWSTPRPRRLGAPWPRLGPARMQGQPCPGPFQLPQIAPARGLGPKTRHRPSIYRPWESVG
jgi:hypothetical protein